MADCTIHLENYTGVYYSGSEIKGRIECHFNEETKVRGVNIELSCKETNKFTDIESCTNPISGLRETKYKSVLQPRQQGESRVFYYKEQSLFDCGWTGQVLHKGSHVHPFSFTLPHNNPSTINHTHGCIYYELKAIVDIPMGIDYEDELIFRVESLIDFNRMPKELQEVAIYSAENKTLCCWCCSRGDITLDVELPKIAFVPGEVVDLKVSICNMSNTNVDFVTVTFRKIITVDTALENVDTIASLNERGVGGHSEHTFDLQFAIPESLHVPNVTDRSLLFQVHYLLLVSCEIPGELLDLNMSIRDIVIGHIKWSDHVEDEEKEQRNRTSLGLLNNVFGYSTRTSEQPSIELAEIKNSS